MVHACSFNDLEHEFADSFSNTTGELKAAVATAEEQQHQLMSEISLEKQRHASLPEKRRRQVSLQEDLVKFEDFTKNLEAHKGQQEAKIQERTAGLDSQRQQVESLERDIALLKDRIQSQDLSATDAERMIKERERLQKGLVEATDYHKDMRQQYFAADMNLSTKIEELERALHGYTAQATALQLIPPNAKNADGRDLRIELNKEKLRMATCLDDILPARTTKTIRPALNEFKDMVEMQVNETRNSLLALLDRQEETEEALTDATNASEDLLLRIQKLEEQYKREKSDVESALLERHREMEQIEGRIHEMRSNPVDLERRRGDQQKEITKLKSEIAADKEANDVEQRTVHETILMGLSHLADYKANVQQRLAEMKEHTQHRACDISSLIVFDPTEPGVPEAAIPGLGLGHSEDLMSA